MLALLAALTACSIGVSSAPSPPTLLAVGVATDIQIHRDYTRIVFADGSVHEVPNSYRQVGESPGNSWLVIIGSDAHGSFLASFPTQGDLPPDCYRENAAGIERGEYIEAEGVMWAKAPDFSSSVQPAVGRDYPLGTRFCFDDRGLISKVVAS